MPKITIKFSVKLSITELQVGLLSVSVQDHPGPFKGIQFIKCHQLLRVDEVQA